MLCISAPCCRCVRNPAQHFAVCVTDFPDLWRAHGWGVGLGAYFPYFHCARVAMATGGPPPRAPQVDELLSHTMAPLLDGTAPETTHGAEDTEQQDLGNHRNQE